MFRRGRNRQDPQISGRREVEGPPVEGVPDYMEMPLRQWVMVLLQDDEVNAQRVALHLKLRVDTGRVYSPAKFLAASTTKQQLLDVVSTMLAFSEPPKIPPVSNGRGGRLYLTSSCTVGGRCRSAGRPSALVSDHCKVLNGLIPPPGAAPGPTGVPRVLESAWA
ncbi:hypothetical protein ACWEJZ_31380 [Streptomyces bacillaris]